MPGCRASTFAWASAGRGVPPEGPRQQLRAGGPQRELGPTARVELELQQARTAQLELEAQLQQARPVGGEAPAERGAPLGAAGRGRSGERRQEAQQGVEASAAQVAVFQEMRQELWEARRRSAEEAAQSAASIGALRRDFRAVEHAQRAGAEALAERDASLHSARHELRQSQAELQQGEEASACQLERLQQRLLVEASQAESQEALSQEALQLLRHELRAANLQLELRSTTQMELELDVQLQQLAQLELAQHLGAEDVTERSASLDAARRELHVEAQQREEEALAHQDAVLQGMRRELREARRHGVVEAAAGAARELARWSLLAWWRACVRAQAEQQLSRLEQRAAGRAAELRRCWCLAAAASAERLARALASALLGACLASWRSTAAEELWKGDVRSLEQQLGRHRLAAKARIYRAVDLLVAERAKSLAAAAFGSWCAVVVHASGTRPPGALHALPVQLRRHGTDAHPRQPFQLSDADRDVVLQELALLRGGCERWLEQPPPPALPAPRSGFVPAIECAVFQGAAARGSADSH
ncbi:unnamed protein product [Prorocentrum cordatum]|uniref:Uncharacterized protein n=1 Tax=Prorocentrum cordatum TaxID=2364126 RepID=A0ABN9QN26_9DINO|nr:unnamed protein product [Polarella glacialis]